MFRFNCAGSFHRLRKSRVNGQKQNNKNFCMRAKAHKYFPYKSFFNFLWTALTCGYTLRIQIELNSAGFDKFQESPWRFL